MASQTVRLGFITAPLPLTWSKGTNGCACHFREVLRAPLWGGVCMLVLPLNGTLLDLGLQK